MRGDAGGRERSPVEGQVGDRAREVLGECRVVAGDLHGHATGRVPSTGRAGGADRGTVDVERKRCSQKGDGKVVPRAERDGARIGGGDVRVASAVSDEAPPLVATTGPLGVDTPSARVAGIRGCSADGYPRRPGGAQYPRLPSDVARRSEHRVGRDVAILREGPSERCGGRD